ncbi:MAG: flagellar hook-associated protein 3 FlgL, partial [Methylophagaceae bacterium]
MRISTGQIFQQGLTAILNQQTALNKTQQQIATGQKLASPADDPVAAVQILNLEREINILGQYIGNGKAANTKLSIEEGVLKGVTNVLQRIRELAVQGLNDTNTGVDRAAIAQEVLALNDQLLSFANTTDASGNYLFSGFNTDTQPYSSIGASYSGDEGQRNIQAGPHVLVETNDPGNAIFEAEFAQTLVTDNASPSSASINITATGVNNIILPALIISFAGPDTLSVTDGTNAAVVTPYTSEQSLVLS